MNKIGFIGMGNMGQAILQGLLDEFSPRDIVFYRTNNNHGKKIAQETNITYLNSNIEVVKSSKYIVLAVKPQMYKLVLREINSYLNDEHVIISIAAGKTIKDIKDILGNVRIVRAMPNTPALIKKAMTGITFEKEEFTKEELDFMYKFFRSFGEYKIISENLIDAVVSVSGSSPAFVYMFIDALADAGVMCGLKKEDALFMAAKTVEGAARMVIETNIHPSILKDNVCSPAGTTIAGVAKLEETGFRNAIIQAAKTCFDKCKNIN